MGCACGGMGGHGGRSYCGDVYYKESSMFVCAYSSVVFVVMG